MFILFNVSQTAHKMYENIKSLKSQLNPNTLQNNKLNLKIQVKKNLNLAK